MGIAIFTILTPPPEQLPAGNLGNWMSFSGSTASDLHLKGKVLRSTNKDTYSITIL
tara:strand:- start:1368 stop:1535 length:168 start_codon:yes stop_codon:yes gene_type:complete